MLAVSTRLGPYEIVAPLGAGGMGIVYRARDTRLEREVAVKVLPEEFANDLSRRLRFEREAKAVAALSHPNILAIHDYGTHESITYAVMELLEGEPLRARLTKGPLPWRGAVEVGAAIADGLAAAHGKGIIHRDLKPENIFLTGDGHVKILDFGLARIEASAPAGSETGPYVPALTDPGIVMGTVGYMSPEQLRGEVVDARSDIFSLSCVLYEMVAGRRPFQRRTAADSAAAILHDEPPALSDLGLQVPYGVEQTIRDCLAKRPEDRLPSARDCASALRALLSDSASPQPLLPTHRVRKQGKRQRRNTIDSLAILPLVNTGGDANTEYLSDGITESIINMLSRLPKLRVMARSTVFRYKGRELDVQEVGRALNVRAVLTGRVLQQAGRLVVKTELVDGADGALLWGEHYDRELNDLIALEETIAKEIADKLRLRLTGDQKKRLVRTSPASAEAYQLYLKGRYHWNKRTVEDFGKSIRYFQEAIAHDPAYALAYAGLADTHATLGSWGTVPPKTELPVAKRFAEQACKLEAGLAEAHAVLAYISMAFDWNWPEAEAGFKQCLRLNPGYSVAHARYAYLLMLLGRFEEGLAGMKRAQEFEPLSLNISSNIGYILYFMGRYEQAIDQLRTTLAMDESFPSAHHMLGLVFERQGKYDQAIAKFQQAVSLGKGVPNDIYALGQAYAVSGRQEQARQVRDELVHLSESRYVPPALVGLSYINLGENDTGFAWLERAYDGRDFALLYLGIDPRLTGVRGDPRFIDLLRRLRLGG